MNCKMHGRDFDRLKCLVNKASLKRTISYQLDMYKIQNIKELIFPLKLETVWNDSRFFYHSSLWNFLSASLSTKIYKNLQLTCLGWNNPKQISLPGWKSLMFPYWCWLAYSWWAQDVIRMFCHRRLFLKIERG